MNSNEKYIHGSTNDDELSDGDGGETVDSDAEQSELVEIVEPLKNNYKILKREEINQLQNDDISTVSNFLSISRGAACSLLRYYNWRVDYAYDQWFADEYRVREAVGLLPLPKGTTTNSFNTSSCCNCFDNFWSGNPGVMSSTSCAAHLFCTNCWKSYIHLSINDGQGCLTLCCPAANCNVLVDLDLVESIVSGVDKEKYYMYLERSYVEDSMTRKWCPAPKCDNFVEYDNDGEICDVTCLCSNKFCWNCGEESHSPADCEMVKSWSLKNAAEAKNTLWILAFTKPCPKCKTPIEKNRGYNLMRCASPCKHEFCWLCLGDWKNHNSCNKFEFPDGDINTVVDDERTREIAKRHLQRYVHYYERWASNGKSWKKALVDLSRARTDHVDKLVRLYKCGHGQVKFLTEAWEQVVECRRVLKWTYTYGFYMAEDDNRRNFFEYLQGNAESELERLHHSIEQELVQFIGDEENAPSKNSKEFEEFHCYLANLTRVTKNSFETLVKELGNGLSGAGPTQGLDHLNSKSREPTLVTELGNGIFGARPAQGLGHRKTKSWEPTLLRELGNGLSGAGLGCQKSREPTLVRELGCQKSKAKGPKVLYMAFSIKLIKYLRSRVKKLIN